VGRVGSRTEALQLPPRITRSAQGGYPARSWLLGPLAGRKLGICGSVVDPACLTRSRGLYLTGVTSVPVRGPLVPNKERQAKTESRNVWCITDHHLPINYRTLRPCQLSWTSIGAGIWSSLSTPKITSTWLSSLSFTSRSWRSCPRQHSHIRCTSYTAV